MKSSNILLRSSFWYAFIALIIFVLFIYGSNLEKNRTELQIVKNQLEYSLKKFKECSEESDLKAKKIAEFSKIILEQQKKITTQDKDLLDKEKLITELQNSITELKNRPPKVITKIQDNIIYKPAPEPYHEFGKGKGKITIFSIYEGEGTSLSIWIDGDFQGVFDTHLANRKPECGAVGAFSKIVAAGKHNILAKDQLNRKWESEYVIAEDQCKWIRLR